MKYMIVFFINFTMALLIFSLMSDLNNNKLFAIFFGMLMSQLFSFCLGYYFSQTSVSIYDMPTRIYHRSLDS